MKLKRLMFLSLGLAMAVSLASCGDDVKPTDPTPETVDPTPSPTPGGKEEVKVNLNKTYIIEEDSEFAGALNVVVKDDVLETISLMINDMPIAIKPIYENGTIKSVTLLSIADSMFYNLTLKDSMTVSSVKISKTTNGIKIGNKAGTIWVEVGNNFAITTSSTVAEKTSATYEDGSSVTIANNKLTYIKADDDKIEVIFNGINLEYNYYNSGKLWHSNKSVQDTTNPLKMTYTESADFDDGNGLLVRTKMNFELNSDYTVKNVARGTYNPELLGIKYSDYAEYAKTDAGFECNMYHMVSNKKALFYTMSYECLEGTNIPTRVITMLNNKKMSETVTTYDDDMNVLSMVTEAGNNYRSETYTYGTNGKKLTETRIEKTFTTDSSDNKVVDKGNKSESTYNEAGKQIKHTNYNYDKTAADFVKENEVTTTYDSTSGYKLSEVIETYDALGNVTGGSKEEFTYDDNQNRTKEVYSDYDSTDKRYYKNREYNYTYEDDKDTTETIEYFEKETETTKTKQEVAATDTEAVIINYSYSSTGYVPNSKEVTKIGTNGLDETIEYYNYNGTEPVLYRKNVKTYGQNEDDYVITIYAVDGTNETVTYKEEKRYNDNGDETYYKEESLYDDHDDSTVDQLTTRALEQYEYNTNGDCTLYIDVDYYEDGSPMSTSKSTYQYDEQGRIVRENIYNDLGDNAAALYVYTWEYSKDGNNDKTVCTYEDFVSLDKQVVTTIKSNNGIVSRKEEYYHKDSSEYKSTSVQLKTYDDYLELIKSEDISYTDGIKNNANIYEYTYGDETAIQAQSFIVYDATGNVKSGEKIAQEYSYVGQMVSMKYYIYNSTTKEIDLIRTETNFAYDESGNLSSDTTQISYYYNANNVLTEKYVSKQVNGSYKTEVHEEYKYDSDGKLTAESKRTRYDLTDDTKYFESYWNPTAEAWGDETPKTKQS